MSDNHTSVVVSALKFCDFCRLDGTETVAQYDAKTTLGPWANLCLAHFQWHGVGLGTGRGQKLIYINSEES